jgi:hypothetical protein
MRRDSKGAAQFVGEDRIEHTAKNEKLKLRLGEAFDITAERKQTNYKRIADNVSESAWRIDLRNAKDEPVTCARAGAHARRLGDGAGIAQAHARNRPAWPSWNVTVPPGDKALLDYTVRVKW